MSQEKVDKYKHDKANRKQIMKKEKLQHLARKCVLSLVALVLVGWVGYSAYGTYEANRPKETVEIDYAPMSDYLDEMSQAVKAQPAE